MNAAQTKLMLQQLPKSKSIMLAAKHGVGKSSLIRQAAEELGEEFYDVRLSQCEVGDIKGLPLLDEKNECTRFLKPRWWPRDPNSKGTLLFDEINRATKDVLQAVFEICLDRRLDGEKLPDGWRVVAAINADDEYDVVELDPALLDRWFYIDFDPTQKEWIAWAIKSGVHPAIVDFIAQNSEYLDPPVGNLEVGKVYPSRRSWVQFHESMMALGLWDQQNDSLIHAVAQGWLGTVVAISFQKFYQNDFSRLKAEDVLDNFEQVKHKIEQACADIEVIASLSRNVTTLLAKRTGKISDESKENLKQFFMMLPADVASQCWVDILKTMKKDIQDWKNDPVFAAHLKRNFTAS